MKKSLFITLLLLLAFSSISLAAPVAKGLVDSNPGSAVLENIDQWVIAHPVQEGAISRADTIFSSPRSQVRLVVNKPGPGDGRHIHMSADEIVIVYKGKGEVYLNGEWTPVKEGDVHVCPRGVTHAFRSNEDMWLVSIHTPPQAGGDDKIWIDR